MSSGSEQQIQEELEALWRPLELHPQGKLTQAKTSRKVGGRHVGAAVDGNASRCILIPCAASKERNGIWKSGTVVLDIRNFVSLGEERGTFLVLRCTAYELSGTFTRLCSSVLADISEDESKSVAHCVGVLDSWRDLLEAARNVRVDRNDAVGLIGELLVLEGLATIDPVRALHCWEGPRGGRHDFRNGRIAIEVKATTARIGKFATVNGFYQLQQPSNGSLYLSWVRLEPVVGGSINVVRLIARLAALGVNVTQIGETIDELGLGILRREEELSFEILDWFIWNVDFHFPKIVPESFPSRTAPPHVIDIQYVIDLDGAQGAPIDAGLAWRLFFENRTQQGDYLP